MAYTTTAAYLSGAICGPTWGGFKGGLPHQFSLRSRIARFSEQGGLTFRDMLLHELMEKGGDFQAARFSADTVVRVERRENLPQGYRVHVWEREISQLRDCADLVDADCYSSDFFGDVT